MVQIVVTILWKEKVSTTSYLIKKIKTPVSCRPPDRGAILKERYNKGPEAGEVNLIVSINKGCFPNNSKFPGGIRGNIHQVFTKSQFRIKGNT